MIDAIDKHDYNDDLLLQDADRTLAQEKYPSVFHVLDHLELQDLFREYDSPANISPSGCGCAPGCGRSGFRSPRSPSRPSKSW